MFYDGYGNYIVWSFGFVLTGMAWMLGTSLIKFMRLKKQLLAKIKNDVE